jgi:RimJ/RimL family protein N-acetyltransferase
MRVEPVTLEGQLVRLEPLERRHAAGLLGVLDLEYFRFFAVDQIYRHSLEGVEAFVERLDQNPTVQGFAIVLRETGQPIGSTSYLDIRPEHWGLEIGITWIARAWQGTLVNPEMKLLLLEHAFDHLRARRVQLKTDARNLQSQAALRKLGAVYEGTLRRHMQLPDGYQRDTAMFSIVREEWPTVRAGLEARLRA